MAAEIGGRFLPNGATYGEPLPDADSYLGGSGLDRAYTRILGDAMEASRRDQDEAMSALAETYADESSWLGAATFFHTLAWQTGRFESAAAQTPEVRLPDETIAGWSPQAAAAVRNVTGWLAASSWSPLPTDLATVASGTVSTDPMSMLGSLINLFPIEWTVLASTENPILSLASLGFWLITDALHKLIGEQRVERVPKEGYRIAGSRDASPKSATVSNPQGATVTVTGNTRRNLPFQAACP